MANRRKNKKRAIRPDESRKRRGMKRFFKSLWITALLVSLSGSGYAFFDYVKTSPNFNVRNVHVTGARMMDEQLIYDTSDITGNENILTFNAASIKARVEALPYVKSCRIIVSFPDTITIAVVERVPTATLIHNSRAYELDADAVVLHEFPSDETPPPPYFTNVNGVDFVEVGQRLDHRPLHAAMNAWNMYSATAMAQTTTIAEISPLAEDDIRMYFEDLGYEIRWGRGNVSKQARRLDILFEHLDGSIACKEYLDLRWGEQLACK